mmetsp:Transcript_30423/g.61931  ORF Transcript_30423/g.61931 Transcript_30423/m.61931 type:complete len:497 (+) Transcript_30423:35-1525(+)
MPLKRGRKRVVGSPRNVAQIELDKAYGFDRVSASRIESSPQDSSTPPEEEPESKWSNVLLVWILFTALFLSAYDAAVRRPPTASASVVIPRTSSAKVQQQNSCDISACHVACTLYPHLSSTVLPLSLFLLLLTVSSVFKVWRVLSSVQTWSTWSDQAPKVVRGTEKGDEAKPGTIQVGDGLFFAPSLASLNQRTGGKSRVGASNGEKTHQKEVAARGNATTGRFVSYRGVEWRSGTVIEYEVESALCWTVHSHPPAWLRNLHGYLNGVFTGGRRKRDRLFGGSSQGESSRSNRGGGDRGPAEITFEGDAGGGGGAVAPMRLPQFLLRTERCLTMKPAPTFRQPAQSPSPPRPALPLQQVDDSAGIGAKVEKRKNDGKSGGLSYFLKSNAAKMAKKIAANVLRVGAGSGERGSFSLSLPPHAIVAGGGGGGVLVTNTASLAGLLAPLVAAWAVGPTWLLPWNKAAGSVLVGGSEGGFEATPESLAAFNSQLRAKLGR